ncbi:MBL fold hydrolase [Bacteroidia bacterium]|nr:MBL fold hydrolase [Bacteroidia bacterium]
MKIQFLSLASGSSGNCYYLGTPEYGILLDAGIGLRSIKKILRDNDIELEQIMAVFVTHDHSDHILAVGGLGIKHKIGIYATEAVHEGLNRSRYVYRDLAQSRKIIEKGQPVQVKDFTITAFDVPHDASDCVGYSILFQGEKLVLVTDVGYISSTVADHIREANHLIIESNYDQEMLQSGSYPPFLKQRIVGGTGHLCNTETAEFLAANYRLHLKNIWLCHLSKDNNLPELALQTVLNALKTTDNHIEKKVRVQTLERSNPSELYNLLLS